MESERERKRKMLGLVSWKVSVVCEQVSMWEKSPKRGTHKDDHIAKRAQFTWGFFQICI